MAEDRPTMRPKLRDLSEQDCREYAITDLSAAIKQLVDAQASLVRDQAVGLAFTAIQAAETKSANAAHYVALLRDMRAQARRTTG